jgi:vacuolar-type H+-ATPase subunit E/Vma4
MNLESLRAALRVETETEAARRRAQVDESGERRLAEAQAKAREVIEQGRLEGAQAGAKESLRRRAAANRRARELRLAAQRGLIDELRLRARQAALQLRKDSRYGELLERVSQAARSQLGADADVEVDPPDLGGVMARAGSTSVDYTLPALVDRAIAELDGQLETLWQ